MSKISEAELDSLYRQFLYLRGVTGKEEEEFKNKMRHCFYKGVLAAERKAWWKLW